MFDAVEIIGDGGATLFGSGKLVMKAHRSSTGCRSESLAERGPEFFGSAASEDLWKELIEDGGH